LASVATVFAFAWRLVGLGIVEAAELVTHGLAEYPTARLDNEDVVLGIMVNIVQTDVGEAVLLIWLVTWVSGRCRPEPTWVDRAGRVLGAAWVCITLFDRAATIFAR
jgi:hypothetical protein